MAAETVMPSEDGLDSFWSCVRTVCHGRWGWLVGSGLFVNLGLVVTPLFAMLVYDKVVHNGVFATLATLACGALLFTAAELLVRALRGRDLERVARRLDEEIDAGLVNALLRPSHRSGAQPGMAARFLTLYRDLASAREFFASAYFLAIVDLPFLMLIGLVIGCIAWPLLVVVVLGVSLYAGGGLLLKRRAQRLQRELLQTQTRKLALLTDTLSSLDTLRTSRAGETMALRMAEVSRAQAGQTLALRHELQAQTHWSQGAYLVNYLALLCVGAVLVYHQWMSSGALVAVSMLSGRCMGLAGQVLMTLSRWDELKQALKALQTHADIGVALSPQSLAGSGIARTGTQDTGDAKLRRSAKAIRGDVRLIEVGHGFSDWRVVLQGINLRIAPGERVGLLGRPGSGKSTLLRIMAGAIAPVQGEVRIDDIQLSRLHLDDRSSWLSFKPQEAPLLAGTLEQNVLLNLPPATPEAERLAALRFALHHSSLDMDLADGSLSLDRVIEEYGANLSGGQRQKVALARALATRPSLLLLDEPSAGLDTESERLIVQRLQGLPSLTLVVVSHSAAMLSLTERLVVLERGKTLADGPTQQLLQPA